MVEKGCRRLEKDVEDLSKPKNIQEPILHKGKKEGMYKREATKAMNEAQ